MSNTTKKIGRKTAVATANTARSRKLAGNARKSSQGSIPAGAGSPRIAKARRVSARKQAAHVERYLEFVKAFPLRSIQSEEELDAAQARLDELLQQPLDAGGEMYLDALTDLVEIYERAHFQFPPVSGSDVLKHLIEANETRQSDLAKATGISRSIICELVSGRRLVNMSHVGKLAKFFHVPPSVFLPRE